MTEINNLDHAIEISIKKYLYSQNFKKGTQKSPALVPHPTVSGIFHRDFQRWLVQKKYTKEEENDLKEIYQIAIAAGSLLSAILRNRRVSQLNQNPSCI